MGAWRQEGEVRAKTKAAAREAAERARRLTGPSRVVFTAHAEQKARQLGITASNLADAVLANHTRRRHNPGAADWQVVAGGQVVVYNWPDGGDATRARVVSFWPER